MPEETPFQPLVDYSDSVSSIVPSDDDDDDNDPLQRCNSIVPSDDHDDSSNDEIDFLTVPISSPPWVARSPSFTPTSPILSGNPRSTASLGPPGRTSSPPGYEVLQDFATLYRTPSPVPSAHTTVDDASSNIVLPVGLWRVLYPDDLETVLSGARSGPCRGCVDAEEDCEQSNGCSWRCKRCHTTGLPSCDWEIRTRKCRSSGYLVTH